jgi:hypothetical protein
MLPNGSRDPIADRGQALMGFGDVQDREVDHNATIADAIARYVMPSAANRQRQIVLARVSNGGDYIMYWRNERSEPVGGRSSR